MNDTSVRIGDTILYHRSIFVSSLTKPILEIFLKFLYLPFYLVIHFCITVLFFSPASACLLVSHTHIFSRTRISSQALGSHDLHGISAPHPSVSISPLHVLILTLARQLLYLQANRANQYRYTFYPVIKGGL